MDFAARGMSDVHRQSFKFLAETLRSHVHNCFTEQEQNYANLRYNAFFSDGYIQLQNFYLFYGRSCVNLFCERSDQMFHNSCRIAYSFQVKATQWYSRHTGSINIRDRKKGNAYRK